MSIRKSVLICTIAVTLTVEPSRAGDVEVTRFVTALKTYTPAPQTTEADLAQVQDILRLGRSGITSPESIEAFNKESDVRTIAKLVEMVTIDDQGIGHTSQDIRINASVILRDVVENRTICAVIERTLDPDLNPSARFNLLQIINIIANPARLKNIEVRSWIQAALNANRKYLGAGSTRVLLDIERNLKIEKRLLTPLRLDYPREYRQCREHHPQLAAPGRYVRATCSTIRS